MICVPCLMKGDSLKMATSSLTLSSILASRKVSLFADVVKNCPKTYEPLISPKLIASIRFFSEGAILSSDSRMTWSGKCVMPQSVFASARYSLYGAEVRREGEVGWVVPVWCMTMIQVGSAITCMTAMVRKASETRPPALRITAGSERACQKG
jgi:hypothetical protein